MHLSYRTEEVSLALNIKKEDGKGDKSGSVEGLKGLDCVSG